MPPDSATLSSAVHVERAMPPHQITYCRFAPPLAQILKETLVMDLKNFILTSCSNTVVLEIIAWYKQMRKMRVDAQSYNLVSH